MRFRAKGNVFFDPDRASINLNDMIEVTLTESGAQHFAVEAEQRAGYDHMTPPIGRTIQMQLWEAFALFGSQMMIGHGSPFEDNVVRLVIPNEVKTYYTKNGKLHSTERPAIEYTNGECEWFVDGEEVDPLVAMLHAKEESS